MTARAPRVNNTCTACSINCPPPSASPALTNSMPGNTSVSIMASSGTMAVYPARASGASKICAARVARVAMMPMGAPASASSASSLTLASTMLKNGTLQPLSRSAYQKCAVLQGMANATAPAAIRRSRPASSSGRGERPPPRMAAGRGAMRGSD